MGKHERRASVVNASPRQANADPTFLFIAPVTPALATLLFIPAPVALPFIAFASITSAALVALAAWSFGVARDPQRLTLWDVAGASAFIGIGAAIFSDSERIIEALGPSAR